VTLALTINGRESIWLLADRRLSYTARAPRDDARKVMFLETPDGVAILGYAGLGATASETEPADWMSAVLRGRNLPLEQSLAVLAEAMKRQFPQHMIRIPGKGGPAHHVIVTAFLGDEPRFYTIELEFAQDRKNYRFRYVCHVIGKPTPGAGTPRFGLAGTGGLYLDQDQDKKWIRPLLRLVRAYDHRQVSSYAVADLLASVNNEVHLGITDRSVGPRCIVAWRNRKEGIHKGGGGHQSYTGTTRDANVPSLPIIGHGMDISALCRVLMPHSLKSLDAMRSGEHGINLYPDELKEEVARLPDKPDENLR
jgi:hypothetical protein